MALIVQKYGGTSVATLELIKQVAQKVAYSYHQGHQMVIVVSAMSGDTNKLINLANSAINKATNILETGEEFDLIAATGEQVSSSLLSLALKSLHIQSVCYCGWQVPIITTVAFKQARIKYINTQKISNDLANNKVVVITGFQGVTENNQVTTLGRGGSDTSALALAVMLKAQECQIYTDVDGVYNIDPKLMPTHAKPLKVISGLYMLEAASLGAKVLHVRSCELGYRYKINIRVLSTFASHNSGTLIMNTQELENYPIISLTQEVEQALFTITIKKNLNKLLIELYKLSAIDMLQVGLKEISFTVTKASAKIIEAYLVEQNMEFKLIYNLIKISLIGSGFRSNATLNQKVWEAIDNIEIFLVTHNEISLSFLVHEYDGVTLRQKLSHLLN